MSQRSTRERVVPALRALSAAEDELHRLGVVLDVDVLQSDPYHISIAQVMDAQRRQVCRASGKGVGPQGRASLIFEALEHLQLARCAEECTRSGGFEVLPIAAVVAQPELAAEAYLHRMAAAVPTANIACLAFRQVDGEDTIFYPAIMKNPEFETCLPPGDDFHLYGSYARYTTNSGTASGMTFDDALLHGLLEVIERDALSLALIDWFLRDDFSQLRRVALSSLPGDLRELAAGLERRLGAPPVLVEVTSDLGVPVYMAFPSIDIGQPRAWGAGASLDPGYAAERALGELLQVVLGSAFDGAELAAARSAHVQELSAWPRLQACYAFSPFNIVFRHARDVTLPAPSARWENATVEQQLRGLVAMLRDRGFEPYAHRWTDPGTPIPVVCALVPGLEMFVLATAGVPVLPTGRGIGRLATMLEPCSGQSAP